MMMREDGRILNERLNQFKEKVKNKKVAVLGIGISNKPLIRFLASFEADITAFDKTEAYKLTSVLAELEHPLVKYSLGKDYLNELIGFDMIFRTPGMRPDLPEIVAEVERGAELTSEMEVFMDLCPARIFAVTGSDGKTTTTSLIFNILVKEGYKCWLGGNIGTPLLEIVEEILPSDQVVLELSSFQLMTMTKSADICVVTNITPNHLDVHISMQEYVEAKKSIFIYQKEGSQLVLNSDNEITNSFYEETLDRAVLFSRQKELTKGAFIRAGHIIYKDEFREIKIVKVDDIAIPGMHNIENYLAATCATINFAKPETIQSVATTFLGVAHRIEFVREVDGVRFYNDSIASSPTRTIAGLNSFNQRVILIAGGKDKNIPFDALGNVLIEKVKCLLLIGPTGPRIEKALEDAIIRMGKPSDIQIIKCSTYEEIVKMSYQVASPGDIVILSPASTSFDMFKNFEERGNIFKALVGKL